MEPEPRQDPSQRLMCPVAMKHPRRRDWRVAHVAVSLASAAAVLCSSQALQMPSPTRRRSVLPQPKDLLLESEYAKNVIRVEKTTAPFMSFSSPSMLLKARGLSSVTATKGVPPRLGPQQDDEDTGRRGGVLGFSVDDSEIDRRAPALRAHGQGPTNVDSSLWNGPKRWQVSDDDTLWMPSSSILSKNNNLLDYENTYRPDFPWIPSKTQIETLKVTELKQVCAERGLVKTGKKAQLQERLIRWAREQVDLAKRREASSLNLFQAYGVGNNNNNNDGLSSATDQSTMQTDQTTEQSAPEPSTSPNSLAEWTRTVDLEPLLNRRQVIRQEKLQGKKILKKQPGDNKVLPTEDYLSVLTKVFDKPSSPYSNREVKQMYLAAKHADQMGDRTLSKRILMELKVCTPHDARIYRRLARLEHENGNISGARAILQEGLRGLHKDNAFLWHGLGQVALSDKEAKDCYRKALQCDPTLPHPYHALGTLEHTQGRIANAMKTLKKGIVYCPTNHRLHHALGDLYRDAKMLEMAERSYRNSLKHGPPVSHGFADTALAYVAYEQEQVDQCRSWLRKAVTLNFGRQANAWVSLARFEESEGNIDAARAACLAGIVQYERGLMKRYRKRVDERTLDQDPVELKKALMSAVPAYRSGDRFFNVYRTWTRLEEMYGSVESVNEVYERASVAFSTDWRITVDWAEYYVALNMYERARSLYTESCVRASSRHAEPYRLYAEFEISAGNFTGARKILYAGAMSMSQAENGGFGYQVGLAELFHTWAVCEWRLGELMRSENLFDHALRMTEANEDGSQLRAYILYSIALLEHVRDEQLLAQHCIALCLKENSLPRGNSRVWDLWTLVAASLGNLSLAEQCAKQADVCRSQEDQGNPSNLASLVGRSMTPRRIEQMTRRDPWHQKLLGTDDGHSKFFYSVRLPYGARAVRRNAQNLLSTQLDCE